MSKREINTKIYPLGDVSYEFIKDEVRRWEDYIEKTYNEEVAMIVFIVMEELLKNTIKHMQYKMSYVSYDIILNDNYIKVNVCSKTSNSQLEIVKEKIDIINNCKDKQKLYGQMMREGRGKGGLGLIRLANRSNCTISYEQVDDNYINIIARIEL